MGKGRYGERKGRGRGKLVSGGREREKREAQKVG